MYLNDIWSYKVIWQWSNSSDAMVREKKGLKMELEVWQSIYMEAQQNI